MAKLQVCDAVHNFIDLYGNYLSSRALHEIFHSQDSTLDQILHPQPLDQAVIQYADSLLFGNLEQTFDKCRALLSIFMELGGDLHYPNFYQRLLYDLLNLRPAPYDRKEMEDYIKTKEGTDFDRLSFAFWICDHDKMLIPNEDWQRYLQVYNPPQQNDATIRYNYLKNWITFQINRPFFIEKLSRTYLAAGSDRLTRPYYPISYKTKKTFEQKAEKAIKPLLKKVPLLVMEPLDLNWKKILAPLEDSPALFLFPTRHHFLHCLQFDAIAESLSKNNHLIYLLDAHPNYYFWNQFPDLEIKQSLKPYFFSQDPWLLDRSSDLVTMIEHFLLEGPDQQFHLTPAAKSLYDLGQKYSFHYNLHRLGLSYYPPLTEKGLQESLRNPFTSSSFTPEPNMMTDALARIEPLHLDRRENLNKTECHILGQIGDPYSEEEALYNTLLHRHGAPKHSLLYHTQRSTKARLQYPYHRFHTGPISEEKSLELEAAYKKSGAELTTLQEGTDLAENARLVAKWLDENQVDKVFFYESNPLNDLICNLSNVPQKICFHSLNSQVGKGYGSVFFPSELDRRNNGKGLGWMKTRAHVAPFIYSFPTQKSPLPPTKALLGLNTDNFVLTTLSPYLDGELSEPFVSMIIKILEMHPKAVWAPFGPIGKGDSWRLHFGRSKVTDRIRPLGRFDNPITNIKACDLYLHPFPSTKSTLGLQLALHNNIPVFAYGGKPIDATDGTLNTLLEKNVLYGDKEDLIWTLDQLIKDQPTLEKQTKTQMEYWKEKSLSTEMIAIVERETR